MSLFRDSLRPPPLVSDAAVRRYVELIRAELEPAHRPSAMGKLGRAVLYSSFALAMSAGGVMAASHRRCPVMSSTR